LLDEELCLMSIVWVWFGYGNSWS